MVNSARLIGPSIAGLVIAAFGEGYCFLIDAISYVAVILSLLAMHVIPLGQRRKAQHVLTELKEGWRYVTAFVPIRSILLLLALVSLVGLPYMVLMPVFAGSVLHGGPHTLGFLMAASGVGALASALVLAMRRTVLGLGRVVPLCAGLFGAALVGFGLSRYLWLSLLLMLLAGFGMLQQLAASNTILQTIVEEDKRGRVMSFYAMAFMGTAPFGSLIAGAVADRIGAPATLIIGGSLCVLGALWFTTQLTRIRALVHPIYAELGIIPEVAQGIQAASTVQTPPEN
jgi:MFS family permease